jgi:hypothetical protein
MSQVTKTILGMATIWPLVYLAILFAFWFYMLVVVGTRQDPEGAQSIMIFIFVLHGITMLWILVLLVIYIRDVFKNAWVDPEKKALWAVVLLLGAVVTMPVYWYLYIRPENEHADKGTA